MTYGAGTFLAGVLRLLVGATFLVSGGMKWRQRESVGSLLTILPFWPGSLNAAGTCLILTLEIVLGVWILVGRWLELSLGVAATVLSAFTMALVVALRRGYTGNCGCFGNATRHRLGPLDIARNAVLTGSALFVAWEAHTNVYATTPVWRLPIDVLIVALIALPAAAIAYLLLAEFQDLLWPDIKRSSPTEVEPHG